MDTNSNGVVRCADCVYSSGCNGTIDSCYYCHDCSEHDCYDCNDSGNDSSDCCAEPGWNVGIQHG